MEDTYGTQTVKLPAGHMVLYPSTSLHHVRPVTRGARISSFFWIQSMIRDDGAAHAAVRSRHGDPAPRRRLARPSVGGATHWRLSQPDSDVGGDLTNDHTQSLLLDAPDCRLCGRHHHPGDVDHRRAADVRAADSGSRGARRFRVEPPCGRFPHAGGDSACEGGRTGCGAAGERIADTSIRPAGTCRDWRAAGRRTVLESVYGTGVGEEQVVGMADVFPGRHDVAPLPGCKGRRPDGGESDHGRVQSWPSWDLCCQACICGSRRSGA